MIIQTNKSAEPYATGREAVDVRTTVVRSACGMVVAGIALFTVLTLSACRTTEGAGREIEALGDNIADSADKHTP